MWLVKFLPLTYHHKQFLDYHLELFSPLYEVALFYSLTISSFQAEKLKNKTTKFKEYPM